MDTRNAQVAPAIPGLRYLEDEAADTHDVVGCSTDPIWGWWDPSYWISHIQLLRTLGIS